MKPVRALLLRAILLALLLLSAVASLASADEGPVAPEGGAGNVGELLPEDPGFPQIEP